MPLGLGEGVGLLVQLLRVVLAEGRLTGREREQHCFDRLPLADGDELHGVAIAGRPRAGGAHALLHASEVLRYPHGILSPTPARRCSVSVRGRPTTFEKLPSTRSTKAPANPCTAYAPAL